jgi:hypothetical protein
MESQKDLKNRESNNLLDTNQYSRLRAIALQRTGTGHVVHLKGLRGEVGLRKTIDWYPSTPKTQ